MSKNLSSLARRRGLKKIILNELADSASQTGNLGMESLDQIREEFLFDKAPIFATLAFYDFLKPENKGKKAYVCNGTACLMAGTQTRLREELERYFPSNEIGDVCCLGRCHENHSFQLNGINYSGSDIEQLESILSKKIPSSESIPIQAIGIPILTQEYGPWQDYMLNFTNFLHASPADLIAQVRESRLRGRGGAGFPMVTKLDALRSSQSDTKYIVCNADEGDPGSFSDRFILEQRPYTVLMGMMIAGYIAGAKDGVIYIRSEYPAAIATIHDCLESLWREGFLGENIRESDFSFDISLVKGQGAYVCGEETALLASIEGQRPEVRVRPPYPTQKGLFQQPTAVYNVETLANLPYILVHGGKAFASTGTQKSSGTKLICLDGCFNHPGVFELEMGTRLSQVVYELGGGFRIPVKALHIGGPLGGIVPVHLIHDLTVDFESFSTHGFLLGHASIVCIPESFPMISYLEHLFEFTSHESCGKCFPCRLGSIRGYELLRQASAGLIRIDLALMEDLLETMESGSLCGLGAGLPLPVRNAMQFFETELNPYFSR
jgi:NADH-quinone oxidoreductase subunit F